ncbi:MAG: tRNA (adenosine(37)-N6)-threonylcarbamoyltransferase complex ATPase subunit type 1 TsaE [Planctomycetota bacterium]
MQGQTFWLEGEGQTEHFGEALGRRVGAGTVIALVGELGAGKTCFVRGLARGLRVDDPGAVASPTYLLAVEHPGPVPLLHMDAYLPGKLEAFLADGGLDYVGDHPGVVAVEWGDRLRRALPPATIWVTLTREAQAGVDGRRLRLENAGAVRDLAGLTATFAGS